MAIAFRFKGHEWARDRPRHVSEFPPGLAHLLPGAVLQLRWDDSRSAEVSIAYTADESLLGLDLKQAGCDLSVLIGTVVPQDRHRLLRSFVTARRRGGDVRCRYRVRAQGGADRWREVVASRGDADDECSPLWWCWVRDPELNAQTACLATPRALAGSGAAGLLSRVSHEMRTPLNGVLGFTRLLRSGGDCTTAAERERYLACIEMAAQHLAAVVEDLIDLPRIQDGTLACRLGPVRLPDIVAETLAMVEPAARLARVGLTVDGGVSTACALADRQRLRQVLLNLLTNAIKYNRRGEEVHVSWTLDQPAGTVRVAVCDRGPGLRPDQIGNLFEPFNRLGAERSGIEGVGLGLVIARSLARMMNGDIEVASEIDRGSTFAIVIPSASR